MCLQRFASSNYTVQHHFCNTSVNNHFESIFIAEYILSKYGYHVILRKRKVKINNDDFKDFGIKALTSIFF